MAKASKKASATIISLVQAIDPTKSKLISYDEAWEVISEYTGLIGGLTMSIKKGTHFNIYKEKGDEQIEVASIEFPTDEVFTEGDWDWTKIFKTTIEYLMKNKLVKKPRNKKQSSTSVCKPVLKQAKTKQISQIDINLNNSSSENKNTVKSQLNELSLKSDIKELRRKRDNLSCKIWDWRKKGKDVTSLEIEYKMIQETIKNIK
mgnify:CR=1 FL=1